MVSVRKFLCWDLYTAGIIIGWVSLASSIVEILASYFFVDNVTILLPGINYREKTHEQRAMFLVGFGLFCAYSVVDAIGSLMLILAVFKRNHFYVVPWLANGIAFVIITLLFTLFEIFTNDDISFIITGTVFILIKTALLAYAWIAVYSLYITLRNVAISKNQLPA